VNGGKGIGTGFSYEGLCYNVKSIITYLKNKLQKNTETINIEPYYEGFKGNIIPMETKKGKKYLFKGKYTVTSSDTIRVTELPIGLWTLKFKEILDKLMEEKTSKGSKIKKIPLIKHFKDDCTDAVIDFTIKFTPGMLSKLITKKVDNNINLLEKTLKLVSTKSTSNMYLFDEEQKLRKYNTIYDIINKYIPVRYKGYKKRKDYMMKELYAKIVLSSNKARFIKENVEETIVLRKKKKAEVIKILFDKNYAMVNNDAEYKYLRSMTLDSLEEENMNRLINQCDELKKEYNKIKKKTLEKLWLEDLDNLEKEYEKYRLQRIDRVFGKPTRKKKKTKK